MRITFSRRFGVAAAAISACAALAACGGSSGGASGGSGQPAASAITVATNLQLSSLNGVLENLVPVNDTIYDALVHIDGTGATTPGLATSWTSNPAGTRWTFTLRAGVKFSNGTAFTGKDVAWTFQQVKADATSMNHSYLADLTSVSVSGSQVVFDLSQPFAAWPREVSLIPIVSSAAYQSEGATAFASKPVGTGPYEVTSFTPDQQVVLTLNPHYWGPAPAIKKVTEQEVDSETTRLTGLQSGSIDVGTLSSATVQTARQDGQLQVQAVPSNLVTYVGFNTSTATTKSVDLREAVSYAIDRGAIAKTLFHGDAKPIGQLLAPSVVGYNPAVQPAAYDPAKAKQLVAQSGYRGATIPFTYPDGPAVPEAQQIAEAVQGYLKTVGINVSLKEEPQATFITDWFTKQLTGMWLFSIQPSTMDADLVFNLTCIAANEFTDPAIASAYVTQATQTSAAQRDTTLSAITSQINSNAYYAPLINGSNYYVSVKGKVSVTPRADGYLLPQDMK